MNSGSGLVETWIPDGGFEVQRRKVKAADGGSVVTECLVPKWSNDDLTVDRPPHHQPCLHRVLADCRHDQIVWLASQPEPGKSVRADLLSPEPLDIWQREARALRAATEMWDAGKNRELVARRITERLARASFHLTASANGDRIAIAYRPTLLIDAIWQQFAREAAGIIHCTKCPAPNCARWFLRSQTRSDRQYCSPAFRMRAWREAEK